MLQQPQRFSDDWSNRATKAGQSSRTTSGRQMSMSDMIIRPQHSCNPPKPRFCYNVLVKFTRYFEAMRQRPDRSSIKLEWIERTVRNPEKEIVQRDGRIRCWARIQEADGKYLRVILLPDRETVHNGFFDRLFLP